MGHREEFREALLKGDVDELCGRWATLFPGMGVPENREQAEVTMHMARTATNTLPLKHRAYSHAWLTERLLPSQLPDSLKRSAERLYPIIKRAVGIAVKFTNPVFAPIVGDVRGAMESAVLEAEADGKLGDSVHVRARMAEARKKTLQALLH